MKQEHVSRTIINKKILAACDDKTKVVLILNKQELQDLIVAANRIGATMPRLNEMAKDMEELLKAAF